MRWILILLALLCLAASPIQACEQSAFSLVTPGVSPAAVYGSYLPPQASVGYLAAPQFGYAVPQFGVPLGYGGFAAAPQFGYGSAVAFSSGFNRFGVVRSRAFGIAPAFGFGGFAVRSFGFGLGFNRFGVVRSRVFIR